MKPSCSRRHFLQTTLSAADLAPFLSPIPALRPAPPAAKVAVVRCPTYGAEVSRALKQSFDLLGGIRPLVKGKTVTVKINLTGTNFTNFLDRPVGETFMTHFDTVSALASELFRAGATRVRLVESTQSRSSLQSTLSLA